MQPRLELRHPVGAGALERRSRLGEQPVPGLETALAPAQQLALVGEHPPVAGEETDPVGTLRDQAGVDHAPAPLGHAGQDLVLAVGPDHHRQHAEVRGQRDGLAVERTDQPGCAPGHREVGERRTGHFGADDEAGTLRRFRRRVIGRSRRRFRWPAVATHAVLELRGAEAPRRGGEIDGFEQAGLAGAVTPRNEVAAGAHLPGDVGEVAEPMDGEALEGQESAVGRRRRPQMRIGMITQR